MHAADAEAVRLQSLRCPRNVPIRSLVPIPHGGSESGRIRNLAEALLSNPWYLFHRRLWLVLKVAFIGSVCLCLPQSFLAKLIRWCIDGSKSASAEIAQSAISAIPV